MEVQVAWLESDDSSAEAAPSDKPAPRKKPPRLPGASRTLPPMPVVPSAASVRPPPPRKTMEVDMSWLDIVDDASLRSAAEARGGVGGREPPKDVDEKPPADASSEDEPKRTSLRPSARPRPIEKLVEPQKKRGKPIPREE